MVDPRLSFYERNISTILGLASDGEASFKPESLEQFLYPLTLIMPLLDTVPNMVFFIKDIQAKYLLVNKSLVHRLGLRSLDQVVGKTCEDLFAQRLGAIYTLQDHSVMSERKVIEDQLELHLYPSREPGWCITNKYPIIDVNGNTIGLAGISYDLQTARIGHPAYSRIVDIDSYIKENIKRHILISELTELTGISLSQLERYCKKIFNMTPRQMIQKARLERAIELLAENMGITDVAMQCGYTDHSAFSRQFKNVMGVSPKQFRTIKLK